MRECYAAALNSGGLPSGAPNYRNENCSCFNAAVEDLDGNTVEFTFRQPHGDGGCCGEAALQSDHGSVQDDEAEEEQEEAAQDETRSVAQSMRSQVSRQSRAKSSMQTALDLASSTSKSMKSGAPSQGISRSNTEPGKSSFSSRTLVGTALGAAAGAALMYAMGRAERANAKDEADHLAYMASKRRSRSETRKAAEESKSALPPPPPRAQSVARSAAPTSYSKAQSAVRTAVPISSQAPPSVRDTRKFHRNFSTTESAFSTRHPAPRTSQAMRMLEATGHNEDQDVQEALGRYNSLRAMPTRSKTQDDYAYAPASQTGRSEARGERRSSTIPVENHEPMQYLLEGPKSSFSKHSTSRHDLPVRSASHASRHRRVSHDDDKLHRNDSGVSMHSARSRHHYHRDREGSDTGRRSSASTVKPSRRDSALYEYPPQPSKPASKAPSLLIDSAAYHPAAISLPPSVASTRTPAAIPPIHHSEQSWEQFTAGEESDGLGDIKTVVPDDSISCADLSKRRRRRTTSRQVGESSESGRSGHHRSSRRHEGSSSKHGRSEASASTVKPVRREERSGKRSFLGF